MSMASLNTLFLSVLVSFLMFAITQAQEQDSSTPVYLHQNCTGGGNTTNGSVFQSNLKTLFSSLSSNALSNTGFYKNTVPGEDPSDSVFGLFMCRGDVPTQLCQQCVQNATQRLSTGCSLSKQAVIWYDECTVRYANHSFFSTISTRPRLGILNTANISNPETFMRLLFQTINKTADEAANHADSISNNKKYFATRQTNISGFQMLYCLAQCTPDLSPDDCRTCLSGVIGDLPWCCQGKQGGRVLYPSCNIRYDLYPFFRNNSGYPPPAWVPPSKFSDADSRFSEVPTYLHHNCSTNVTADNNNSFKLYLNTLLSYMSSNATNGLESYKGIVEDTVHGLFMCRGDLPSWLCQQCVLNATQRISSQCSSFQEAIIWYSHCMLRYSNSYFFSQVGKTPNFQVLNDTTTSSSVPEQEFFTNTLSNMLANLAKEARDSNERYVTKSSKLNNLQTLYTLGQCTSDLSSDDCKGCLEDIIGIIPWSRLGSVGGRVLYPSCNLRFELFQFFMAGDELTTGNSSPSEQGKGLSSSSSSSRKMILIIVPIITIISVMLFSFAYYLIKKKTRKGVKAVLRENFGRESDALEPLQFKLDVIEAATNNFSDDNKIGRGGFGEVYKGSLSDGRHIAVKRLLKSSKQGVNEFKNEVLLIAKLQHRNLVTFIGFCLEEQDKMLIYEYVPNKSLDYFLFDSQQSKLLSWFERYKIIGGIARGILYLHEHSRLKVIHRDLKPSNVLLDENMIPKISDFGMARIVEIDQDQGSTNRIVGTFGYMSPEYAMFGQFSEKSDIFSFGVMVIEIITGKKNLSSYEAHRVVDGLLSYVWRQWRAQTPLSIIDSSIKENYSETEVIKCIQIGLLCVQQNPHDRPTMVEVVSYLSSHLIELPSPQEPAFFLHGRRDLKSFGQESSSSQSHNGSTDPFSINDMSISQFLPR